MGPDGQPVGHRIESIVPAGAGRAGPGPGVLAGADVLTPDSRRTSVAGPRARGEAGGMGVAGPGEKGVQGQEAVAGAGRVEWGPGGTGGADRAVSGLRVTVCAGLTVLGPLVRIWVD